MSRLRNFVRGVASGYVQIGMNVVFTLVSVPLALHYLSKAEFAIWALVSQVAGYLALVEFGMGPSLARILADYKDNREGGIYGGILKVGIVVLGVQGLVIVVASLLLAPALASLLGVEAGFREIFIFLLRGNGLLVGLSVATKVWSMPFWGYQRYDVTSYAASAGFVVQLGVLWAGFHAGLGLKSMLLASAAALVFAAGWSIAAGVRLGFYPSRANWGKLPPGLVRELFHFGRDYFVMAIGAQLLSASQIIIISRTLGLEAAATWAICSKLFMLAQQGVGRIFEASAGALTEMYVRGETGRLRRRVGDVVGLTASLAATFGILGAAANGPFVAVWTRGAVAWPAQVDFLLGVFIFVACVSRCQTGVSGVAKRMRVMRYIYFFEGLTFALLAVAGARILGFSGVVGAAILAMTAWSGLYGIRLTQEVLGCAVREVFDWMRPAGRLALILGVVALAARWSTTALAPLPRLLALSGLLGPSAFLLLWSTGLPESLRLEALAWLRSRAAANS